MKAVCLTLAITAVSVGQSANGPITGSWSAKFEGRTFIRLEIKTANGTITGGISLGNHIEIDPQGMVKRAAAAPPNLKPIFGATRKGATVTFFMKDGNDTEQFELRLLENREADLLFVLNEEDRKEIAAEGVPPPKPIRLTKAG